MQTFYADCASPSLRRLAKTEFKTESGKNDHIHTDITGSITIYEHGNSEQ